MGIGAGAAAGIAAGVGAAGSVAGSVISSNASSSASKAQQEASQEALAQQQAQFAYSQAQESPYIEQGDNAETLQDNWLTNYGQTVEPLLNQLTTLGNSATAQQALAQTPGYQFTLNQGLQATQNAAAARGLGVSGAALKGAASYATGLADQTYQQQYQNASNNLTQAQNTWSGFNNALAGMATLGANTSVQAGSQAQNATNNTSNLLTGAGNASAAGTIGSANALTGGIGGVSNALTGYNQSNMLNQYLSNNGSQYGGGNAGFNSLTASSVNPSWDA